MRPSLRNSANHLPESEAQITASQQANVIRDLAGGAGVLVMSALAFVLGAYGPQGMFMESAQPAMAQLAAKPAALKPEAKKSILIASNDTETEQPPSEEGGTVETMDDQDEIVQDELIHDPGAKAAQAAEADNAAAAPDDPWAALEGSEPPPDVASSPPPEDAPPQAGQEVAPLDGGLAPLPE
jgi:hypothetical protein